MIRNILGSVIALVGATAAVLSPFRTWYGGRLGWKIRVGDLFTGITVHSAAVLGSVFLPLLLAAAGVVAAVILRSRALMAVAGLVVALTVVLWGVQQYRTPAGLSSQAAGRGVGLALGGAALILVGAAVMSGRPGPGRHRATDRAAGDDADPYLPEHPPYAPDDGPDRDGPGPRPGGRGPYGEGPADGR